MKTGDKELISNLEVQYHRQYRLSLVEHQTYMHKNYRISKYVFKYFLHILSFLKRQKVNVGIV